MWGEAGKLYFHTVSELGFVEAGAVTWLLESTEGIAVTGLWGNAIDEVFIAIQDETYAEYRCGGSSFLMRYDGETFHQM